MNLEQQEAIARKYTSFETLEDAHNGTDFCEIAKWTLVSMLAEAYALGVKAGKGE